WCGAESRDIPESLAESLIGQPYRRVIKRGPTKARIECEVSGCTTPGYEVHHWAPREVWSEDCEDWPTSRLCIPHHHAWHERMDGYRWGGLTALRQARARKAA